MTNQKLPIWIIIVVTLCCAIEAAFWIAPFLGYGSARVFASLSGAFWSQFVWAGHGAYRGQEFLMFVTYGLVHGGVLHLLMNMISLVAVARPLQQFQSAATMALTYVLSQFAAAGMFAIIEPTGGPMVGASGAVFGLAGALIAQAVKWRLHRNMKLAPVIRAVLLIGGLNLALTFAVPDIAWQAHLGGAIAGLLIGLILPLRRDRSRAPMIRVK